MPIWRLDYGGPVGYTNSSKMMEMFKLCIEELKPTAWGVEDVTGTTQQKVYKKLDDGIFRETWPKTLEDSKLIKDEINDYVENVNWVTQGGQLHLLSMLTCVQANKG